jgi:hypothetical protein
MNYRIVILSAVLIGFGALSVKALAEAGYWGILAPHFQSWAAGQVLADLVIVCGLSCLWMIEDARSRPISAWPYVFLTLLAGSFGPLLYLLVREWKSNQQKT